MLNFIEKLRGNTSLPDAATTETALATTEAALALSHLADPDHVQRELAVVDSQILADDAAWERLDRTSNPHAFTQQQEIANRRPRLETERDVKRRQLATAKRGRAAFVALVEMLRAMDQQSVQDAQRLYTDFLVIASPDERRSRLESLDGLVRARARLGSALAAVSPAREFRRGPDPLGALADDLRARADEIDRLRAPGTRRSLFALPEGAQELIAALNEGRSA